MPIAVYKTIYYIYIIKQQQIQKAMTTQEIYTEAIRTLKKTVTLVNNVANGCLSDKAEMEAQLSRIPKIKAWAEANDKLNDLRYFMRNHNWGMGDSIINADKVAKLLY